jgi:hypothetical protein
LAIQHICIKNGPRGSGEKHARYVAGIGPGNEREDLVHLEDGNLPKWAPDAEKFFAVADKYERDPHPKIKKSFDGTQYEKIVRGRAYKEVEAAIPREAKDPIQWAKDYVRDLLGDQHAYRLAVHDKAAGGGGRNVHMHLMFSTRIMDCHDREAARFFKRANNGTYTIKGEIRHHAPGSGGAAKSKYWDSQKAIYETREKFERHVQRVAPDFKMERSDAPEPKMGPALKNAGKEYSARRDDRMTDVAHLRSLKMVRGIIDSEIKLERERERKVENPASETDELWATTEVKKDGEKIEQDKNDGTDYDFF